MGWTFLIGYSWNEMTRSIKSHAACILHLASSNRSTNFSMQLILLLCKIIMEQMNIQQCVSKFIVTKGTSSAEIHWQLSAVFRDKNLSWCKLSGWFAHFWDDHKYVLHSERPGMPYNAVSDAISHHNKTCVLTRMNI